MIEMQCIPMLNDQGTHIETWQKMLACHTLSIKILAVQIILLTYVADG